ncbi:MAG: primosomal protein N' [marine bacterium B5-7]|nr:MAG: primosomal protein N' [marine bacterium B5-7]
MKFLKIAIHKPFRQAFDYLPPAGCDPTQLQPGVRVEVPFGRQTLVGMLLRVTDSCDVPADKLKAAITILDEVPMLPPALFKLACWASDYYQHPIGEVLLGILPKALRQGKPESLSAEKCWYVTSDGWKMSLAELTRAPKQAQALRVLREHKNGLSEQAMKIHEIQTATLKALENKTLVRCEERWPIQEATVANPNNLALNDEQLKAVNAITSVGQQFKTFLLDGVTGSGKTEVYFEAIDKKLKQQQQVMVLVPEISLTPQSLQRFQQRFSARIATLHSGMTDSARLTVWSAAKRGKIDILIGTRSAVFTPLPNLGLIIIDESHDTSFKQHEGFRYHARDVAIFRAQSANMPIVLGSATPSLESLYNVAEDRFQHLHLTERAGVANPPAWHVINCQQDRPEDGLTQTLIERMKTHLAAGNQVLLFLNRRGFAPVLHCHDCGWSSQCKHCDVNMTLHQRPRKLCCHHCGALQPVPSDCPTCHSPNVIPKGVGTEQLADVAQRLFPEYSVTRIDRDTTKKRGELQRLVDEIHAGKRQILIGTQMLAKGHHFPKLTLVGVLQADAGLFSSDFRGSERLGQLLMQVAGRAGRGEQAGEVLIQTYHPEHPLLQSLIKNGYPTFAQSLLQERELAGLPPYCYHAVLQAEAKDPQTPFDFLQSAKHCPHEALQLLGPVPAVIARKAGHYRAHLLVQAKTRRELMQQLPTWLHQLLGLPQEKKVRWKLDVDPMDGL